MENLLLFFALPISTIILASVLETFFHCPLKVAAVFFAVFLIVTFAAFDSTFLIYAIVYTILAFISAFVTKIILHYTNRCNENDEICANNATINTISATINTQNQIDSTCNCNTRYRRY